MGADVRALAAGGVLVLVLGALVAATSDATAWLDPGSSSSPDRGDRDHADREGGGTGTAEDSTEAPGPPPAREVPAWLRGGSVALLVVVAAGCLVTLVSSFRLVVRRRRLDRGRAVRRGPVRYAAPETAAAEPPLEDVLVDELAALGEGTPRNAVVAAWVRLEEVATARGLPRQVSDSPAEFVVRALAAYSLDTAALQRLADLYREARFSEHALTEAHRAEARTCLERLVAGVLAR